MRRGLPYFSAVSASSETIIFLISASLPSIFFKSEISFSSCSVSFVLFIIYSRLKWRSLISATYSACALSMPKPIIRLGTTSASSSVLRTMATALSMSSSMALSPLSRWSFSSFLSDSNCVLLRTQPARKSVHAANMPLMPSTFGTPFMSILKLHEKLSSSGVSLKRRHISFSGSLPLLRSMVIFRPSSPVSSRTSDISRILPCFARSIIFSTIASTVVVGGISVISMQLAFLSYL